VTGTRTGPTAGDAPDEGRDPFTVRGGAGGTRACLIALIGGAIRAERAAELLSEAGRHAVAASRTVAVTSTVAPASGARAAATLDELTDRTAGVPRCREALVHLAAALRGTAAAYARADQESAALLRLPVAAAWALGETGPVGAFGLGVLGLHALLLAPQALLVPRLLRYTPTPLGLGLRWLGSDERRAQGGPAGVLAWFLGGPGLLPDVPIPSPRQVEALLPALAAYVLGLAPGGAAPGGQPVAAAAALLAAGTTATAGLLGRPLPGLVVAPLVTGKGGKGGMADPRERSAESVADVLGVVDRAYDVDRGAVAVQRIEHPDGTRSWVVAIPGTEEGSFGGPVTTDLTSNLELMAGVPSDRTETVIQAMEQAGIRRGEPVILAGHSQGGMAAARVAAAVGDRFTVAGVVTAGSPVGGMPLPADVPALHLEHAQDYVPAADGSRNPDTPNRTTVTRDLSVPIDGVPALTPGSLAEAFVTPHDLSRYIETAELVADQDDRSVTTFLAGLERVLDDGTGEVTTQLYVGVRVPDDVSGLTGAAGAGVCRVKAVATSWS